MDDEKILKALKNGPLSKKALKEALGIAPTDNDPVLDRNLQQLRRAGKIEVLQGRWSVKGAAEICPTCEGKGWVRA